MQHSVFSYGEQGTVKGTVALEAELYTPDSGENFPLVTWLAGGNFRINQRSAPEHPEIARAFTMQGYACAFIDMRVARPSATVSAGVEAQIEPLRKQAQAANIDMDTTFYGPRALVAVEDVCAFLNYMQAHSGEYALSGRNILGGSSTGAITALNTLYLSERLGLQRPPIETVLCISGGFAYPKELATSGARIFAQHNPGDTEIPVSSIRSFADAGVDPVVLVESDYQKHGELPLEPSDTIEQAVRRMVFFDQSGDPLTANFPVLSDFE